MNALGVCRIASGFSVCVVEVFATAGDLPVYYLVCLTLPHNAASLVHSMEKVVDLSSIE